MDNLPSRNDDIYLEIEQFEDYELTECIAYEMAIRSDEAMKIVNDIISYYNENTQSLLKYYTTEYKHIYNLNQSEPKRRIMIIDIDDELLTKVKSIVKSRNTTLYKQLEHIKELKTAPSDILIKARAVKTNRKKEEIKTAIKELIHSKVKVTKYQVNKTTGIAYRTLDKYFDDIFDEVLKEIKS